MGFYLVKGFLARFFRRAPALGPPPPRRSHAAWYDAGGSRTRWLLLRPTTEPGRAFAVDDIRGLEPLHERLELVQRVEPHAATQIISVDEVQPEPFADEDE
jgi:hypothetical protein